ncbi:MAG: endonuclease III [bacterium]|nr:endonuclease III [bacterium]
MKKRSERAVAIDAILAGLYPNDTALKFHNTLQLLVATILSAQCTDGQVNMVTPALFEKYPDAKAFAGADLRELEQMIFSTGFYRQKAKSIQGCCKAIVEKFGGEVPSTLEEMVTLPGVGRKTGNLVLGIAEGIPGVVVDTHVKRLSNRMGLTENKDPEKIEKDINALLPPGRWMPFSSELIFLGRDKCSARRAKCEECPVSVLCPKVGVV